ncbi:AraC family transcriptional regulator [Rhizocola hellebori]|uniref:AraC family transcriptional regulator n=2 Tax=Rhizocola hellebori TaxID=1392758 RepID=A0A8J3QC11_9ACTN|nr:AraC family transcriptional regulator [Rhizocola hellebori]
MLDVTGPAEVFAAASRLAGRRAHGYRVGLVAEQTGPIRTSTGIQLIADESWATVTGAVDTVIVPGGLQHGLNGPRPVIDANLVGWLAESSPRWRRVASVCSGAHMLAAAGLLDGRKATTHWFTAPLLAQEHPEIEVDPDPIFVREGRIWTSAGVSSGMDLALAMVADDHSEQLAREVARWLVMYLRRPGHQSQFSAAPAATPQPRSRKIRDLQHWVVGNLATDLSVPALARRAHMSERHFARVFAEQTATTPASFVEASRTEAARRLLEETDAPIEVVATRCGFGSAETLYRTFRRRLGTTPNEYRHRFRL